MRGGENLTGEERVRGCVPPKNARHADLVGTLDISGVRLEALVFNFLAFVSLRIWGLPVARNC